jgi:hypothetical protein
MFDLIYDSYLEALMKKDGYETCYMLIGQLELIATLYSEENLLQRVKTLHLPLRDVECTELLYSLTYGLFYFFEFNFEGRDLQMFFIFNPDSGVWDEPDYYYDTRNPYLAQGELARRLSAYVRRDHPLLLEKIAENEKEMAFLFSFVDRELSMVKWEDDHYYFSFVDSTVIFRCKSYGGNTHLCKDPSIDWRRSHFEYCSAFDYVLQHTGLLSRLKNHPSVRLKQILE